MSAEVFLKETKSELEIIKKPDSLPIEVFGVKVQDDGTLVRPDDIYKISVSDFVVEFDRNALSTLSNITVAAMIENFMNYCKQELKLKGIKVISSHMRTNPPVSEPHILITILDCEI